MQIKIFGCKIYISLLFFTMLISILLLDKSGVILYGIMSVTLHEIGHLIAMLFVKCVPDEIILQPAGIMIKRSSDFISLNKKLIIASAGCLMNIVLFIAFIFIYKLTGDENALLFAVANLSVCIFNLIFVSGLDGYDILINILSRLFSFDKARLICKIISVISVIILAVLSIYVFFIENGNISIMIFTLYLTILTIMNLRC